MGDRPLWVAAVVLAAFALPVAATLTEREARAFRFGIAEPGVAAIVPPGERLCQRRIDVPVGFSSVRVPGRRRDVTIEVRGSRAAGGSVDVCVSAAGGDALVVPGTDAQAEPVSDAMLAGRPLDMDLELEFLRERPVTLAGRLDEIGSRLALYKPGWLESWMLGVLAVAIALGVPVALVVASAAAGGARSASPPDGR